VTVSILVAATAFELVSDLGRLNVVRVLPNGFNLAAGQIISHHRAGPHKTLADRELFILISKAALGPAETFVIPNVTIIVLVVELHGTTNLILVALPKRNVHVRRKMDVG
jgi:hypothetical protein